MVCGNRFPHPDIKWSKKVEKRICKRGRLYGLRIMPGVLSDRAFPLQGYRQGMEEGNFPTYAQDPCGKKG